MILPLLLILLSSLNTLVSGLQGSEPVEGFTSLDGVEFYHPSESELYRLDQTHAEAVQLQASHRHKPPREIASHGIHRRTLAQHELAAAQKLVDRAAADQSVYNEWLINNPRQNNYRE
jgi:hypothetical protein